MQTIAPKSVDQYAKLGFPMAGIDLSQGFNRQMPRQMNDGEWGRTTPSGINVRAVEAGTTRARGGQRAGLKKYLPVPVVAGWIIQGLDLIVSTGGAAMQTSQSGRVVMLVAVSQGRVFYARAGDTSWTETTSSNTGVPPLNFTGIVYSAANNQLLYFADGTNWVFFRPSDGTVNRWAAGAGSLPVDSSGNAPRLICTWRGRTVLSGIIGDPQNWFMSAVGNATDFDYSPASTTPTQAVAGNNAPQGLIGDVVTGLCPYTDDVLVIFGDHTIYMMSGDPMANGQIDLISDSIGGAWGICWCKDPYGNIYFVSNKTGIYTLVPGQQPQRISQPVEQLLLSIDTGLNSIRLMWDDRFQGLHVFISPLAAPGATNHLFFEQRTGAWWQDQFGNSNFDPLCCVTFDGNTPGDRVPLIGSWDGYVRAVDPTATTDDGVAISSQVLLGPILTGDMDDMLIKEQQAVLGETSGNVSYSVLTGTTAEQALTNTAVASGTWGAGRQFTNLIRRSGHALYLKLTASNYWAMETVRASVAGTGKVRRRGKY